MAETFSPACKSVSIHCESILRENLESILRENLESILRVDDSAPGMCGVALHYHLMGAALFRKKTNVFDKE